MNRSLPVRAFFCACRSAFLPVIQRVCRLDDGAAGTVLDDVQELAIHTPRLTLEVVVIPCQKSIAPSITLVHAR